MFRTLIICMLMVLGMAVIGCSQTRTIDARFTFTATGDDGSVGQASYYDIRYSTDSLILITWDSAIQVIGEPAPLPSGAEEDFTIPISIDESNPIYYFALRIGDEEYNWSGSSNTIAMIMPDWKAPAVIFNFNVEFLR